MIPVQYAEAHRKTRRIVIELLDADEWEDRDEMLDVAEETTQEITAIYQHAGRCYQLWLEGLPDIPADQDMQSLEEVLP